MAKCEEHAWRISYRNTVGDKKTTMMFCPSCSSFKEVAGHVGVEKRVAGLGDAAMRRKGRG